MHTIGELSVSARHVAAIGVVNNKLQGHPAGHHWGFQIFLTGGQEMKVFFKTEETANEEHDSLISAVESDEAGVGSI